MLVFGAAFRERGGRSHCDTSPAGSRPPPVFLCTHVEHACFSFQTVVLGILMRSIGNKNTILLGLGFQILQLAWYGFGSQPW